MIVNSFFSLVFQIDFRLAEDDNKQQRRAVIVKSV